MKRQLHTLPGLLSFLLAAQIAPLRGDEKPKETVNVNFSKCVQNNYPQEARQDAVAAQVSVSLLGDKNGKIWAVDPLNVRIESNIDAQKKGKLEKIFRTATIRSFLHRQCPVFYRDGKPSAYRVEILVKYRLD